MKLILLLSLACFVNISSLVCQDTLVIDQADIAVVSTQMGPRCENGIKEAKADIAKGIINIKSVGLPRPEMPVKAGYKIYTVKEILKEDYQLDYRNMGCEPRMDISCYNNYVDSILQAKYGSDYYKKAEAKAKKLTQEAKLKCIHKSPSHAMSEADLKKLLSKGISKKKAACLSSNIDFHIDFDIDASGRMQNLKFPPEIAACAALKAKLKKSLAKMGAWQPAMDGYNAKQPHNACLLIRWVDLKIDKVQYCQYILEEESFDY